MAADSWLPHQFRHLSTRLVTQNGIVIMGLAALVIVLWSRGSVDLLVVLYSINVFLTFTLSLLGLCIYWWRARGKDWRWLHRLAFSGLGLAVTSGILGVTVFEKFGEGGNIAEPCGQSETGNHLCMVMQTSKNFMIAMCDHDDAQG